MSGERRVIQIEIDGSQGEISARRLEQSLNRIDRAIDPLGVATKQYGRDLAYLKAGLDSGALSADQHSAKIAALGRRYDEARARLGDLGRQTTEASNATKAAAGTSDQAGISLGGLATRATAAVAAVAGLALGARALAEKVATAGDEVRQMTARLNVLTGAADGSRVAFDAVYRVAKNAGVGLDITGAAFSRLAIAAGEFGATTDQVARVTDVVLKLGRVGGASAEELASGVQQLGQALASGKLQGDELRSILEGMPLVGKAIAREFGVGIGQLKQLGEEGKLSADRVFKALISAGGEADTQFRKLPPTLEQASNRAANGWKVFTAAIDDSLGVSRLLADGLDSTADRAEKLAARIRGDINVALADTVAKIAQLQAAADKVRKPVVARDMPPGTDPNIVPPVEFPGAPLPKPRAGYAGQTTAPLTDAAMLRDLEQRRLELSQAASSQADAEMYERDRQFREAQVKAQGAADRRVKDLQDKALTGAQKATRDYNQAVAKLNEDLAQGLIKQDRYNQGLAAARTVLAAASGGAKETAKSIEALNEALTTQNFSKQLADNAYGGAAALAQLEAQAQAAKKAMDVFDGKRNAAWESQYADSLLADRANKLTREFRESTLGIERENQLLQKQIDLVGQRPEIVDREIALLKVRLDLEARGVTVSEDDIRRRVEAVTLQERLTRQTEESRKAAELWAEPFKNAIQGVQSTFTDFFEKVFSGGVKSFSDLADSAKRIWFRLMAEMASVAIIRPVIQFVGSGLGSLGIIGPQTMQALGITGGGSTSGSSRSGGAAASGGSFNPFNMFGQGGFSGMLGRVGDFLQTPFSFFGQSPASYAGILGEGTSGIANMQYLAGLQPGVSGYLGSLTPMQGIGALGGVASGIFQLASGNPIGGIGSLIGAGVSLIPGIGQIAGPVISIFSSILGGLFKSKPDIKAQGWHDYDVTTGRYTGGQTFAQGVAAPIAPGVGNDALKLIEAFGGKAITSPEYYIWAGKEKTVYDATVTAEGSPTYARLLKEAFANGAQGIDQAQWAARKALWTDAGNVDLPIGGLTEDSGKLMQQLALLILKAGVRDNDYTGLSDTTKNIIRNYPEADTQGLASALQWGKETYDVLVRTDTITASEKAITGLKDSFQAAILKAKEYALATDGLVAAQAKAINKYASDFQQSISDRILGIQDPAALAQVQLDREFDQIRKEAAYLNEQYAQGLTTTLINVNDIEKAYGLERQRIVEQQVASLQDLWKRLTYGDLSSASPATTLAGAQGTYQDILARAQGGDATALASLSGAASDFLNAQRAYTGNDARFESERIGVLSDIAPWVVANGNTSGAGLAQTAQQAGQALTQTQAAMARLSDMFEASQQENAELRRTIERFIGKMAA